MRFGVVVLTLSCGVAPAHVLDAGLLPVDGVEPIEDAGVVSTVPDAGGVDAGVVVVDAGVVGGGEVVVDPQCNYEPVDNFALVCGGAATTFHHLESTSCPTLVSSGGHAWATVGDAALGRGCDTACVWVERIAAQFVYCHVRGEYTGLVPGGPGQTGPDSACAPLYYYDTIAGHGYYASAEAFMAANPCP